MYLEAEVYGLILDGFGIVVLGTLLVLIYLFWRSRNQAVLWFGGQTLFLSGAFWFFFRFRALCLRYDPHFSMYSEEQSVHIACAGFLWALSMLCMLIGIYRLLRKGPVIHQF